MIRRKPPPAEVVAALPGERPLAWALAPEGWAVASARRLVLPGRDPLGWEDVVRAAWDEPVLELHLPDGQLHLTLDDPGGLPEVVRERVTASVVVQHHVLLRGDRGVRIVARRPPGGSEVTWRVTFDSGLDHRDPQLRAEADRALAELRSSLGL
ncbi:MAG TPA: hypothetical protein PLT68_03315 [Actinomycetota bacterium]|nr:hypothetical protein [Actinomycetota bacterium]